MQDISTFIHDIFSEDGAIFLHEPKFKGNEKLYLNQAIDSTFVSSVGAFVDKFEADFATYIGTKTVLACMNGTAALHIALILAGVENNDEVITQPLTFVATCNAIHYQNAQPVFVDVDRDTMGMSPDALLRFLQKHAQMTDKGCLNKKTGRLIKAVVPMHTFGHPCRIDEIASICKKWGLYLIEDAAEALGSTYKGKALGTFGDFAAFSFNGNKIITTGGGGMLVTKDSLHLKKAKHLTTTAKTPHPYEFFHDEIGYNYRMPNLNAALGCAQLEQIETYLLSKRQLAQKYKAFFKDRPETFIDQPNEGHSNFWLNAIALKDPNSRDTFLQDLNEKGVKVRPIWTLMNKISMFSNCQTGSLENAEWLEARIVNLPSSVRG